MIYYRCTETYFGFQLSFYSEKIRPYTLTSYVKCRTKSRVLRFVTTFLIVVIYCPAVPTLPNAIADTKATSAGTIVTYSCEEGFNAEGEFSFTAECMDNEKWNISKSEGCQSKLKAPIIFFHLQ